MPQNGSLGLKVLSGLESVRESRGKAKVDSNTRSKELDFFPVTDWIKATGFFPVRASERWTNLVSRVFRLFGQRGNAGKTLGTSNFITAGFLR